MSEPIYQVMNNPIPSDDRSPCVKICALSPCQSWCVGCGRTRADIALWLNYSRAERIEAKTAATERLRQQRLQNG